jgi:hypothetical protein
MNDTLRALVPVLWLVSASLASAWALRHFLLRGRPAATLTIVAASATGGLWFFASPRLQILTWPYLVLMLVALVLALAALLVPVIGRWQSQRA